ncbi:hypothetical protein EV193_104381 [Herbihabitans rhizosphaerae]|uniref:Uncharacterized protein n=1 Tax=Herbihabitans rhizosphaerae TaxID=1872711 RepID=A0A4Q7KRI3_9PSEU|nr:hypothetical protein EV193_104381 [Herbihabitans rhizosphaerae]
MASKSRNEQKKDVRSDREAMDARQDSALMAALRAEQKRIQAEEDS